MRYEDMRLSLGARPPRSAGGEGCCERADAAGQDAHTQCCTVRSPQHRLSWVFAPPATERQLPWLRTAAADVRNHGGGAVGRNTKCTCDTQPLLPSVRKALRTLNRGKICATCMIRGVCAAKRAPSWQDIHVVYPPTAICRAFRIHGAHILPKPAHFEYTAAICCHEGALSPSEAIFGIHRGKILPSSDTRERITSTYRHRQTPGNAFRGHVLPCPTARWRTAAAYRQQSHPSAAQGAVCSFPPYPARAHPQDAAVPSCGGGRRRDEGAGALMRTAYLGRRRGIGARRPLGARCIDVQPTVGVREPSAAGSQPAGAWSRLGRGTY